MNRSFKNISIIVLSLFMMVGCYNNSHVRPQRVIEPGEQIISLSSNMTLGGPSENDSYRIDEHGVAGQRLGLSYLKNINGNEHGVYLGLGSLDFSSSYILGYDLRKIIEKDGRRLRYSLYSEYNQIKNSDYVDWGDNYSGNAFQFRPAITSITSETNQYYGGIHGILGFGTITNTSQDEYYDYETGRWYDTEIEARYNTSTMGIGITAGHEQRKWGMIIQTQFDLSLLNHKTSFIDGGVHYDSYEGFDPIDEAAIHIGIGTSIFIAPNKKAGSTRKQSKISPQYNAVIKPEPEMVYDPFTGKMVGKEDEKPLLQFDPETGEIIEAKKPALKFDPLTGKEIEEEQVIKFDPMTGLPIEKEEPSRSPENSLLRPQERAALTTKGLRILVLNGKTMNASVLDLNDRGIVIKYKGVGEQPKQTLYYHRINTIQFGTPTKGGGEAGGIALAGCAAGIGVPLLAALLTDEFELLGISILTAPLGGVGGLIYGLTHRERYDLNFLPYIHLKLTAKDLNKRKKQVILNMTKQYLDSGFPSFNLVK